MAQAAARHAQNATPTDQAYGVQADAGWAATDHHTIRFGMLAQAESVVSKTLSDVLPVDASGTPTTDVPEGIANTSAKQGGLYGVYVRDEWRILPTVTINSGLRFDGVDEYTSGTQLSPRLNVVWKPTKTTTFHVGYARYFVPPPFELVGSGTVAEFVHTTGAAPSTRNSTVLPERSDYYDIGIRRQGRARARRLPDKAPMLSGVTSPSAPAMCHQP